MSARVPVVAVQVADGLIGEPGIGGKVFLTQANVLDQPRFWRKQTSRTAAGGAGPQVGLWVGLWVGRQGLEP